MRKINLDEKGTSIIEFGIVLPFLIMLVFGVIQWGQIIASYVTLRQASAVGARALILDHSTATQAVQAARAAVAPMLDPALATAIVLPHAAIPGSYEVTVTYNQPILFSLVVPGEAGGVYQLQATTVAK